MANFEAMYRTATSLTDKLLNSFDCCYLVGSNPHLYSFRSGLKYKYIESTTIGFKPVQTKNKETCRLQHTKDTFALHVSGRTLNESVNKVFPLSIRGRPKPAFSMNDVLFQSFNDTQKLAYIFQLYVTEYYGGVVQPFLKDFNLTPPTEITVQNFEKQRHKRLALKTPSCSKKPNAPVYFLTWKDFLSHEIKSQRLIEQWVKARGTALQLHLHGIRFTFN